ncbi:MAG: hypothetical protein GTN36_04535 [Candidatus Aenigmarchaeota archaeon]|nr:hypothetical protein [Candidatus Aenigmarchaeota archaeon]
MTNWLTPGEFTKKDLEYYRKERFNTDYIRFMKTWEILREEVKRVNPGDVKKDLILELSIKKISRMSGFSGDIVRKRLKEMKDFGVIDYDMVGRGRTTEIYFSYGKESSYLDKMLEKDRREKLL